MLGTCIFVQGARVIVGDLQVSDGEKVAREIGDNATFVPMDVSVNDTKFNKACIPVFVLIISHHRTL